MLFYSKTHNLIMTIDIDILSKIPWFMATTMEINFDAHQYLSFANNHYHIPLTSIALYASFITVGPTIMKMYYKDNAFQLTKPLALWNAGLCLFSTVGMIKTAPTLLHLIVSTNFEQTICANPTETWGTGPTGTWVMLFCFSKIPELIDTVFIVLRMKPLQFLHWYHHITVLLYCWTAFATMSGSGLYFVAMNYSVHSIMYGYYCLQSLKMVPSYFPTYMITASQIAQMLIGTFICMATWYFKWTLNQCHNKSSTLIMGTIMYGSYLYLFCDFALKKFYNKKIII